MISDDQSINTHKSYAVQCPCCARFHQRLMSALCTLCEAQILACQPTPFFLRRRMRARRRALPWIPRQPVHTWPYQLDLFDWSAGVKLLKYQTAPWTGPPTLQDTYRRAGYWALFQHRTRDESWRVMRSRVVLRDGGICMVCGTMFLQGGSQCHVGHLIDKHLDGANLPYNLVVQCAPCNGRKPITATIPLYMEWAMERYAAVVRERTVA
jgi:5-methylcytosine-specific restriction endonuclease McrA